MHAEDLCTNNLPLLQYSRNALANLLMPLHCNLIPASLTRSSPDVKAVHPARTATALCAPFEAQRTFTTVSISLSASLAGYSIGSASMSCLGLPEANASVPPAARKQHVSDEFAVKSCNQAFSEKTVWRWGCRRRGQYLQDAQEVDHSLLAAWPSFSCSSVLLRGPLVARLLCLYFHAECAVPSCSSELHPRMSKPQPPSHQRGLSYQNGQRGR